MKEKKLTSWEAFEAEALLTLEASWHCAPLFRGQSVADWPLDTTLERFGKTDHAAKRYYLAMLRAAEAVETVTGKKWELSKKRLAKDTSPFRAPRGLAFMVFLRQNGFPSPLLDWSRSPFIAAFFAFCRADPKQSKYVAIFEYVEYGSAGKSLRPSEAAITRLGPWIGTDKKHFLQQSEYTVCRKGGTYVSHEEAFSRGEEDQDMLTKYLVPISERGRVLGKLRHMNINPYSIFETTEALLEYIAPDAIDKD
jgi:hypothetical protein